ncbi:MAG: hypothetical protein GXP08_07215 [Gammaproteobacteria bacterium]|nr:hypothetical protein [Gammaproteobacteria bacterium]
MRFANTLCKHPNRILINIVTNKKRFIADYGRSLLPFEFYPHQTQASTIGLSRNETQTTTTAGKEKPLPEK